MAIVAGADFGTLSVRVTLVDDRKGRLGLATAEYPLHRSRHEPDRATQSHIDHMNALARATRDALRASGVRGEEVMALAVDTTGSSVVMVGEGLRTARRVLSLVRSPRESGSRGDHGDGASRASRSASNGAEASIRMNGAFPSCCIGCGTIQKNASGSSRRSSIATWWSRR